MSRRERCADLSGVASADRARSCADDTSTRDPELHGARSRHLGPSADRGDDRPSGSNVARLSLPHRAKLVERTTSEIYSPAATAGGSTIRSHAVPKSSGYSFGYSVLQNSIPAFA